MDRIGVVEDLRFRDHRPPAGHPERPERLEAVHRALAPRAEGLLPVGPRPATDEELLRVHTPEHLDSLTRACREAPAGLDPDTFVSAESLAVARLAAGSTVELARRVARDELRTGLAAVRPPGHHAEAARPMGFCLLNHVAVAARALQQGEGLERIAIVDWDVHHGNGTQHSFEDDPGVLYVSTHQFPHYPGTGDVAEAGRGPGRGATLNVPMPPGCGNPEYLGVFHRIVAPALRAFRPEIVLVSCGFDAHRDDPLAGMELDAEGFGGMARLLRSVAEECCRGRLLLVLEGGYADTGLEQSTGAVLDALAEAQPRPVPAPDAPPGSTLRRLVERVAAVHGDRLPALGAG